MALGARTTAGYWWVENLLRPLMIAVMMTCMVAPAVRGLEWFVPSWEGGFFLVFVCLANLEGILSERLLRRRRISGYAYLASRLAEFLVLVIVLKVLNYLPQDLAQLWAEALTWAADPAKILTDVDFFTIVLLGASWFTSLYVGHQVVELDVREAKEAPPEDRTSTEYYLWLTEPPLAREREAALNWLGESFLWGGITILALSTLVHFAMPGARDPVLPVVLYFLLGVALLSQARFSVSYAGWQAQGIPIQPGIARRWLLWALIFLLIVVSAALLLPTDYALGPVLAIYTYILMVLNVVMFVISFITYLVVLLLALLFPSVEMLPAPALGSPPPVPTAEQTTAGPSTPWFQVLMSIVFWLLILSIAGYALFRFLQDRWGLLAEGEVAGTWWAHLRAWLRALWQRWRNWQEEVGGRLALRRPERPGREPLSARLARFFSLRRLSPRDLVRYFYLSAERRAADAGQPRRPGETPYEYRASLDERFSDLEPDLAGLTEAFVQARYSPRPVEEDDAEAVKPLWQRIKAALRRKRFEVGVDQPAGPPGSRPGAL